MNARMEGTRITLSFQIATLRINTEQHFLLLNAREKELPKLHCSTIYVKVCGGLCGSLVDWIDGREVLSGRGALYTIGGERVGGVAVVGLNLEASASFGRINRPVCWSAAVPVGNSYSNRLTRRK
ncbi:hypothetical protein C0J52_25983 [Blattella germanica]|nr:hypothetical protein C0J52_25983 [Blattella germanica]